MKKSGVFYLAIAVFISGLQISKADVVFSENFGSLSDGTTITTDNTGLNYARTSTGAGSFLYATNDASSGFSGASADLFSSSGSLTGIGETNLSAFAVGTLNMSLYSPSASDLSGLYITLGTGANFINNSTFSTTQLTAGFSFFGGNLQTRTTTWENVGTDIFSGNTVYNLSFVFNDSGSIVNYGDSYSLAPGTADIWINGSLYGDDIAITGSQTVTALRIYTTTSSGAFEVDNLSLSDSPDAPMTVPEPSTWAIAALGGFACLFAFRRLKVN